MTRQVQRETKRYLSRQWRILARTMLAMTSSHPKRTTWRRLTHFQIANEWSIIKVCYHPQIRPQPTFWWAEMTSTCVKVCCRCSSTRMPRSSNYCSRKLRPSPPLQNHSILAPKLNTRRSYWTLEAASRRFRSTMMSQCSASTMSHATYHSGMQARKAWIPLKDQSIHHLTEDERFKEVTN